MQHLILHLLNFVTRLFFNYMPSLVQIELPSLAFNYLSIEFNGCRDNSKIIFLALPTPPGEDGSADLKYVLKVANDLGPLLQDYTVIVDKSTVPVGTADKVTTAISKGAKVDFDVLL